MEKVSSEQPADLALCLYFRWRAAEFPTVGNVQGKKQKVTKGCL